MKEFGSISIELFFGFLALFFMMKVLGKTQFAQLTPFDFISSLILGELLGNAVYDPEVSIWNVLFATGLWGVMIYVVEMLSQKAEPIRGILEGEPSIVIRQGQLKYDVMKKNKIDINQLQSLVRQAGTFSLSEVEYAILEPNGQVSVLPKSRSDQPTRQDLQLPEQPVLLPFTLILDGRINADNLRESGRDENWLKKQLSDQQIDRVEDVLYAEWKEGQDLFVNTYS